MIPGQPQIDPYREIRREVYRRCEHPHIELRYKDAVNGTRQYREQCMECGGAIRNVKKASIAPDRFASILPFDEELQSHWWRTRSDEFSQRIEAERQEEHDRWWRWYSDYLKSPEWQERRYLVLQRANGVCEGCETNPATQVHHRNYQHVGDELLFDLVAICKACHQKAHPDKVIASDD